MGAVRLQKSLGLTANNWGGEVTAHPEAAHDSEADAEKDKHRRLGEDQTNDRPAARAQPSC
jgi:hypothetical protein